MKICRKIEEIAVELMDPFRQIGSKMISINVESLMTDDNWNRIWFCGLIEIEILVSMGAFVDNNQAPGSLSHCITWAIGTRRVHAFHNSIPRMTHNRFSSAAFQHVTKRHLACRGRISKLPVTENPMTFLDVASSLYATGSFRSSEIQLTKIHKQRSVNILINAILRAIIADWPAEKR